MTVMSTPPEGLLVNWKEGRWWYINRPVLAIVMSGEHETWFLAIDEDGFPQEVSSEADEFKLHFG